MLDNVYNISCNTLTFNMQNFVIWSVVNFNEIAAVWTTLPCLNAYTGRAPKYLLGWNPTLPQVRLHGFQAVGSLINWSYFAEWISCMYQFFKCLFGALTTTTFVAPFYHMIKTSLFFKQYAWNQHWSTLLNSDEIKKKKERIKIKSIYLNENGW